MWDSQIEMEHITGKLTNPGQYKSKKQIDDERKAKEKLEKQKIREELLKPEPINDFDTRLYSDSLATQSEKSKSELQITEEKEAVRKAKKAKDLDAKKKLEEIQKQNQLYQKQLE